MTKKKLIDANNSNKVVDQTRLCGDDDRDDSSLFWECIPNPQQSQFNFCSITPTISNDNDEQRDAFQSTSTVSPKSEIKVPHVA
ncbi:unnamed protein product [Pseudo-nitzschia multistriata]|uniref:Uncharacterized protein n=1 Tax=Pseudo-nitzschia multistriata TaxID=183589 RepID=A0A448ZII4_9STRA|nr:unnamed protein product [Pseudo-nitzschia multistriata]